MSPQEAVVEAQGHRRDRRDRVRAAAARTRLAARNVDHDPRLHLGIRRLRDSLPGDARFGDPMSLAGRTHVDMAGRALVELTGDRPGALREMGLGGLQVWQVMLERVGAGSGEKEVTLAFLDLANFSTWALDAGDDHVLTVLRRVSDAWEPPITDAGGTVVKRLGDGLMAVFDDPQKAVAAVLSSRDRLGELHFDGFEPRLRAGLHTGKPRRVGGDYIGVAVNVAARIGERAKADQILISGDVLHRIDSERLQVRRKRYVSHAKGTPSDLTLYRIDR